MENSFLVNLTTLFQLHMMTMDNNFGRMLKKAGSKYSKAAYCLESSVSMEN
jgi:hypothetical protein